MKTCTGCKTEKSLEEFGTRKRTSPQGVYDYVYARCKKCRLASKAKYEKDNRDKHLASRRKFYANNQEREIARRASWRKANPEKHRAGSKEWALKNPERVKLNRNAFFKRNPNYMSDLHARFMKDSVEYRLVRAMRSRFYSVLKQNKDYSVFEICDYTVKELKNHIESLFKVGMSWENYGKTGWVIDHIRPLASFDIMNKEEMATAWALENLQPLWANENSKKNSTYNNQRYFYKKDGNTTGSNSLRITQICH